MVRAKFKVFKKETSPDGSIITLKPVTGGSTENDNFYKYTPAGMISLATINPAAAAEFVEGDEFYVDFEKVLA